MYSTVNIEHEIHRDKIGQEWAEHQRQRIYLNGFKLINFARFIKILVTYYDLKCKIKTILLNDNNKTTLEQLKI